jgi:hypothetical protein
LHVIEVGVATGPELLGRDRQLAELYMLIDKELGRPVDLTVEARLP